MSFETDFYARRGDPRPVLRPQPPPAPSIVAVTLRVLDRAAITLRVLPGRP